MKTFLRGARPLPWLLAGSLLLTGCAQLSPDGGFTTVETLTTERIGQSPSYPRTAEQQSRAAERRAELLRQPLSAGHAVELALLSHPRLQAAYAELGIAEADLVRAGRLANPSFSFGRLGAKGAVEIDRVVLFDVLGLLTMPLARQVEQQRFEQVQWQAALETVAVAAEVRQAYFEAVAARQLLGYHGQVKEAADTANELARRMVAAGNFSRLEQLREQAFQADATAQLARARHQVAATRERLVRAMGLPRTQLDFQLPERLPDLPPAAAEPADAEQAAMDRRLDVQMARRSTAATAASLGLTRATGVVNVLHAGYLNASASGEPRRNGYEIELELPVFDAGTTRVARAEALYQQSLNRTAAVALQAQSEVREAYAAYRTAHDLASHYRDEVVPLRRRISEENLLRYNGMLASVFDLLVDAREQIAGVVGAVESLRDFWVAESQLQSTLAGPSPGGPASLGAPRPSAAPAPASH